MMSGSWAICAYIILAHQYMVAFAFYSRLRGASARTCIENKYSRSFFVTTAMTSSCTQALNKNVTNAAESFESLYEAIVSA